LENTLGKSSYNSQIRQLRILAEAALTQYDIGSARLTLLAHRDRGSTIFRVDALSKPGLMKEENGDSEGSGEDSEKNKDTRYVLRLCDPQDSSQENLLSELLWLSALQRDTDLCVPQPIPTRDGEFVTTVQIEDIVQERRYVLLRWVPGRFVDSGLTPTLFERVGMFQARLHQHARHFIPPEGFVRPHWDWMLPLGEGTVLDPAFVAQKCDGLIGGSEYHLFSKAAERIREVVSAMPRHSSLYGLVHGDLQQTNYLFYKGTVNAIHFNSCCWNYYLFDMATTLCGIEGREDEEQLSQAYLRGYELVRALPMHYEEQLSVFTALYKLNRLNTLFRSDEPDSRAAAAAYLARLVEWLAQFVAAENSIDK
jgi:Ser/Thr protein kinase RdoA (MazF antagonist)